MLSNGRTLRLLRDSSNLVGQAYVEFDLQGMFDGEVFADFVTLFTLAHASRLERRPGADGESGAVGDRWIERWRTDAIATGTRALNRLRGQVEQAIEVLGTGFLQAPGNQPLRDRLASGVLTPADMQRGLLRLVYRILFWSVAEDRGVLLAPDADPAAVDRYTRYFSSARLRRLARTRIGTRHSDLWDQTRLVFNALGQPGGAPQLGLPGLGGLFESSELDIFDTAEMPNAALLKAMRLLSTTTDTKSQTLRSVDFAHLGAEELGSIYEGLLELHPTIDPAERTFSLGAGAGNERKTSGSYYTPSSLVDLVLDTALDPVLDRATATGTPEQKEQALLALRVCDPACGSGHFLVAAARRIAHRVAQVRNAETEPTPAQAQEALHDVVRLCIYGVDLNPMAAELAKVSLWLEAVQPGRPLGFLDAHIRVGNSLIGATPALMAAGVPDGAYTVITGDDRATANELKRANRAQRNAKEGNAQTILGLEESLPDNVFAAKQMRELASRAPLSLEDVALQRRRYEEMRQGPELERAKAAADAWTAAFFQPQKPGTSTITTETVGRLEAGLDVPADALTDINYLAAANRFFHWHIEFPDIFTTGAPDVDPQYGWTGGFDVMVGNPPWETVQMSEKEFFASRDPEIAEAATTAKRKQLILQLEETNPRLHDEFIQAVRSSEASNAFTRGSVRFPLTARGKTNTYALFAETLRDLIRAEGRAGIITPTGIATDATTAPFIANTIRDRRLATFFDFENRKPIFVGVDSRFRFAASTFTGTLGTEAEVPMAFMLHEVDEIPVKSFSLAPDEILLLNPNTGTLPVFATRRDADITIGIYRRHPVLIREGNPEGNPWGLAFKQGLFNMSSDSGLFRTAEELEEVGATFDGWAWTKRTSNGAAERWLPLYEAKMLSHWNHRFSTYRGATQAQVNAGTLPRLTVNQLDDPDQESLPRYWVAESDVEACLNDRDDNFFLGCRRLGRSSDVRTLVPYSLPRSATGDSGWLIWVGYPTGQVLLGVALSGLVADYLLRQKLSGTTVSSYYIEQLAVPTPETMSGHVANGCPLSRSQLVASGLELTFTSHRIAPYARDLGDHGWPFRWDLNRRALIQAELDAAMMHVYGLDRSEVEYVLDSFTGLRDNYDMPAHGEFRTKRLVLEFYDLMAQAAESGVPYETPIDPPPGQGPRHAAQPCDTDGSAP